MSDDLLERLEVWAAWLKPAGATPAKPAPLKYQTLLDAIAEIKKLREKAWMYDDLCK